MSTYWVLNVCKVIHRKFIVESIGLKPKIYSIGYKAISTLEEVKIVLLDLLDDTSWGKDI